MPLPPLETTSPADWRYTAEGGGNLVVSFAVPAAAPYAGHALRLRKRKKRAGARNGGDDAVPSEVDVDFGARVIAPLLGAASVVTMEKIALSRRWLEELVANMRVEGVRPLEREMEDEVDGVIVETTSLVPMSMTSKVPLSLKRARPASSLQTGWTGRGRETWWAAVFGGVRRVGRECLCWLNTRAKRWYT